MKLSVLTALLGTVLVAVEASHTFMGTNVQQTLAFHTELKYGSKILQKRVEYFNYTLPVVSNIHGKYIQGILAYDLSNSGATANVTAGGIGTNFVQLRMKSDKGKSLKYDIYIYA